MIDHPDTFLRRLQFIFAGIIIVAILFLLSFLLPATEKNTAEAKSAEVSSSNLTTSMSDNPNVVAGGMEVAVAKLGQAMDSAGYAIGSSMQSAATSAVQSGRSIARTTQSGLASVARTAGRGVVNAGSAVGGGVSFVVSVPGNIMESVSNVSVVRAVIRPSDSMEVPIIDPNSPELRAALAALPPAKTGNKTTSKSNSGPAWPIRGAITTHFGVPHWPYQHTHSGMDISDGRAPGITPIKPFRPGRVIDTIHSNYGLGNHVIVDHGNGVTSVYAHLASISVRTGQAVDLGTTLGHEGSTGASTGTHLHFEIRVNGQAADPRQFISGQP